MEHPRYTLKDWEQWKEDWELIDGFPYTLLPSPTFDHNDVIVGAIVQLGPQLSGQLGCNCKLATEMDWRIDQYTVVRPDVSIVCGNSSRKFIDKAPALIIEVLSPSTSKRDVTVKKMLYQEQGVLYYLIVDPRNRTMECNVLENGSYVQREQSNFPIAESCVVGFNIKQVFAALTKG